MKKIAVVLSFFLLWISCADEVPRFTVPHAPVNFRVDVGGYDFELNGALGYKVFTPNDARTQLDRLGYGGLLLVRDHQASALFAYDLSCPYEDQKHITVTPSADGKAVCKTCGSVFVTMYGLGSVESGPGKEPLQRYKVIPQSNQVFVITN